MTDMNVVRFPKRHAVARVAARSEDRPEGNHVKVWPLASKALSIFTVVVGVFWPILRWVLGIDVFFKFVLMLWRWDTPGSHAGWVFTLHLGVLVALMLLIASYKQEL